MTILPLYLQDAGDQSPRKAGLSMIPFALRRSTLEISFYRSINPQQTT